MLEVAFGGNMPLMKMEEGQDVKKPHPKVKKRKSKKSLPRENNLLRGRN